MVKPTYPRIWSSTITAVNEDMRRRASGPCPLMDSNDAVTGQQSLSGQRRCLISVDLALQSGRWAR